MTSEEGLQVSLPPRPTTSDVAAWKAYWKAQGQHWRTEPEIGVERQKYLGKLHGITPNIEQGIYPFKDIKLSRADVEWLLVAHEKGRGPVFWYDSTQQEREGLDLRGAILSDENLRNLPLPRLCGGLSRDDWFNATNEQRHMAAIHLERTDFSYSHLEGSVLTHAYLQGAILNEAHLEGVDLFAARFDAPVPASFRAAYFDVSTKLELATIGNDQHVGVRLLDIHWGNVNLTGLDWTTVQTLFDEHKAQSTRTSHGKLKDKQKRLRQYREATRTYRQLALVLQQQGMSEEAARFAYRAQKLQRVVSWQQRKIGQYLFSWFLDLISGYGYRPRRSLCWYLVIIIGFALAYHAFGGLAIFPPDAFIYSLTSFHGRGFFPGLEHTTSLHDPLVMLAALEAVVGLFIEISFIATFTQRYFGK